MSDEIHRLCPSEDVGRIDAWLAQVLPLSRSRVQTLLRAGDVTVDGHTARPSFKVGAGQEVVVRVPPPEPSELVAQDIPIPILYMDEHVIVVDKPADIVVHPSRGHPDGTLVNALLHLLSGRPARHRPAAPGGVDDPPRPGLVHRLDRGTSGVLVVARTPSAHAHLTDQFAERSTERRYAALVWDDPGTDEGTVDAPLGRNPEDRLKFVVREGGRRAVTHWRVLGRASFPVAGDQAGGRLALVECRLETGRTHQVRVHMRHIGHPIVGDPTYGWPRRQLPASLLGDAPMPTQQLLHAWLLGFTHPATGERLRFASPLRPDFRRLVEALGLPDPTRGP